MKKLSLFVLAAVVIIQSACTQPKDQTQTATAGEGAAPAEFQRQLEAVFEANVQLKQALVQSDAAQATQAAQEASKALDNVDMTLLEGKAHDEWMQHAETMSRSASQIVDASDLAAQREAFADFSDALYHSVKSYGLDGKTAYYQYCPMAFNNQGGYWLSENKEIRNPYFGESMLKCGSTKEVLE